MKYGFLVIALFSFITTFTLAFILDIKNKKFKIASVIVAVLLFLALMIRLSSRTEESIFNSFNLTLSDVTTIIDSPSTWIFSQNTSIFLIILYWFYSVFLITSIMKTIFNFKFLNVLYYFSFIVGFILPLANFDKFTIAIDSTNHLSQNLLGFYLEVILLFIMFGLNLTKSIKQKEYMVHYKDVLAGIGVFFIFLIITMPIFFFRNLFGNYYDGISDNPDNFIVKQFNNLHIMMIGVTIVFFIVPLLLLKNKSFEVKRFFLVYFSFSLFFTYFHDRINSLSGLPLQLCNTAVILGLLALMFNLKGLFYFNFFANVLGALLAILLPTGHNNIFAPGSIRFWTNHIFILVIPLLCIYLKVVPRPKMKDMSKAIAIFSVYFVAMVFLNGLINNSEILADGSTKVDYFFLSSDSITSKFNLKAFQYDNFLYFRMLGRNVTIYYAYCILYLISFVFLMFFTWYIYDQTFRIIDLSADMKQKLSKIKKDAKELKLSIKNGKDPSKRKGVDKMIEINNFSKKYNLSKVFAVKDFNLTVNDGEVFGFIGHNGAGKSTTIKSLVGIQSITEGDMLIEGYSIKTQGMKAKRQMSYVSDNHAVYERLTGREYVNYVADLYQVPLEVRNQKLEELAKKLNILEALDNEIKSYSHGMHQKIVVISALVHNPKVWILDEPLLGLDPISALEIQNMMREHALAGNIVFFSSHDLDVVGNICDRVAIIHNGHLQGIYSKEEFVKNTSIKEIYENKKPQTSAI
ncbi:MAG: YwaF family protein [Acholeplasmatales bacterium]|jgi:ABC-2 type transport system ATP-binding protein|nr:YwaF family protein [Acholeplasmatales bacterium]